MTSRKPSAKPKVRRARKPIDPAELDRRRYSRSIRTMFTNMGFTYISTEGSEAKFGLKVGEIDAVYVHENVILIVEDTTSNKAFDHAKNKKLLAEQILNSKAEFIAWLKTTPGDHPALHDYTAPRFKVFFLYFSRDEMDLDEDQIALLKPMIVVNTRAQNYFDRLAKTIRKSAKTDLWRFLDLHSSDIGPASTGAAAKTINTTIISPDDSTGFVNGVRLVSFMISADVLLRNSYVLRKDNWGYSSDLYQRLIDAGRIKKIRRYVAAEGSAFLNNIILGLPPEVSFQTASGDQIALEDAQDYNSYRMTIPDEFNSLCIIDGQHRVFAHFEGADDLETRVGAVRTKVHLLATGLVFPSGMDELERLKIQSEIFLDINSNSKPVPADVLLAIQSLRAPYADVAIARRVLERLNRKSAFRGMFQLSQMDQAPIKIASIVKFALRYLVDLESDVGLYALWASKSPGREILRQKGNADLLAEYVEFCASNLDMYFRALKENHRGEWQDPESKIVSTTVINAMIIALRRSLPALGLLSYQEYNSRMANWAIDFDKARFAYTSSQYARFSQEVLRDLFSLREVDGVWIV